MARSKRRKKPVANPTAGQDERQLNKGYSNPPAPKKPKPKPVVITTGRGEQHTTGGEKKPPYTKPAPKGPPAPSQPDPSVTRRQRLLRASGFAVPVDGRWGPKSQTAWVQYSKGVRPLVLAQQKRDLERRRQFGLYLNRNINRFRTEANKMLPPTAPPGIRGPVGASPEQAKQNLRDKFSIAIGTGRGEQRPDAGPPGMKGPIKKVKLTKQQAIQAEIREAKETARLARLKTPAAMTLDDLVALTIDPLTGRLNPQNPADVLRVQRWLKAHGHPKLADDGRFGRETFEALRTSYQMAARKEHAEALSAVKQLVGNVHRLHPEIHLMASPEQMLETLQGGGSGSKRLLAYLMRLQRTSATDMFAIREAEALKMGRDAFGPFADTFFKTPSRQLLRSVQMAYGDTTAGRIAGVLASSNDTKELRRALNTLKMEERKLFEAKAKEAARGHGFWNEVEYYGGKALTKPSEWTRNYFWTVDKGLEDFIYGVANDRSLRWDANDRRAMHGLAVIFLAGGGSGIIAHETDYDPLGHAAAEEYRLKFEKDHFWLGLGMALALDPYNLIPGGGVLKARFLALERLGYAVNAEGELVSGFKAYTKSKGALALTLPARIGRQSTFALRVAGYQYTPDALKEVAKGLTKAKSAAVSTARAVTTQALKHHFQPGAGVEDLGLKIDGKAVQELKRLGPEAERHALIWLQNAYKMFLDGRISIYSDINRKELTALAAGLEANFAEYSRIITIEQKAISAGEARRQVLADAGKTDKEIEEGVKLRIRRVREQYGAYIVGAPHPHFGQDVDDLVQARLSAFRDTMFPILQNRLMRDLDELGEELFDATGRWVGRGGAVESNFRRLARSAFSDAKRTVRVRNPVQGMEFTADEARALQNQEIGRRISRLHGWAAREAAAGRPRSEEDLTALAQEIRDEVASSWDKDLRGVWTDKRDDLFVPDLYARQLKELYEGVDPEDIPTAVKDAIAQIPDEPGKWVTGPIQTELRSLVWAMDAHTGLTDLRHVMNDVLPHLHPGDIDLEAAQAFSNVIDEYSATLGAAWARHYPQALRKNYAYWYAMSQAESIPMKLAYRGLSGALQLWIFATLPLRPGWAFRNVVDNTAKILMAGVRDPRIFFVGAQHPGAGIASIFELGLDHITAGIAAMDRMFGTDALKHWETILDNFWATSSDILGRIFDAHNIEVPESVIQSSLFRPWDDQAHIFNGSKIPAIVPKDEYEIVEVSDSAYRAHQIKQAPRAFQNGVWELMAQRPEAYFKRMLYRDTYKKAVARMEKDPAFRMHPVGGFTDANIDIGYDRRVLNRLREDMGMTDSPMQFNMHLREYESSKGKGLITYGEYSMEEVNGEWTHVINIYVPPKLLQGVQTQARAQEIADRFTGVFLHEFKHARQDFESFNSMVERAIRKMDTSNTPSGFPAFRYGMRQRMRQIAGNRYWAYQALPEEYTARTFARQKLGEYRGLVQTRGAEHLPADYVNRPLIERKAFEEAWAAVDKHLFDYSRITTIEDNIRLIFPFAQFWRKNTMLWAEHFVNKPWLLASLAIFQEQLNQEHAGWPEWSRRYFSAQEIGNGISNIPGLDWLGKYVADQDVMYDPMNYLSFAPMYRAFKNENPLLPADKAGAAFIAPMIDALNDWGLSMNPLLVRKPLEIAGVANYRAWQSIFPETSLIQAFTRKYFNERFPQGLNIEAWALDPVFQTATMENIEKGFNQYVQLEMANQALRGETVSRARAERKIQDFYWVQAAVGFFSGAFVKRMTPEDFVLYQMAENFHKGTDTMNEKAYDQMTTREKKAYRLFKLRKIDRVEFDRYVQAIPLIKAYYKLGDWEQKERMKQEHPEIIPYVEPMWAGRGNIPKNYVKTLMLVQDTEFVKRMGDLADDLDLPYEVRKYAMDSLVTPKLQAFWDKNITPQKWRDRQLRLLYFRHMKDLNDQFHEIPDTDYEAKKGYLAQNPLLVHFWHQSDQASDEYLGLINSANADLREVYFEYADADDWDGATKFLHQYPFIFEFTKAADRVDDEGNWITKGGTGHGSTEHSRDYLKAKAALDKYFALDTQARRDFLNSGSAEASLIKWYFSKYGRSGRTGGHGLSEHARDYLAVKGLLDKFFGMPELDQVAWLERDGDEQRSVKRYFKKWGSKDGQSEHSRDFQKNQKYLDQYFKLPKPQRRAWLDSGTPAADAVLAYFKRWSKLNHMARLWAKLPESKNPELNRRIQFWHKYFSLYPDKRPAYAIREAERHGVFIWGPMSKKNREQRESEYLRKAYAHGISPRAAMFLYVKPLLDEWHKLKDRAAKRTFIAANPELGKYLDHFSKGSATGDKKLDNLMKGYFQLPDGSPERSEYLKKHPKVQDYFDEHSTPAQRAMHRLLEIYFRIPPGSGRKDFLITHPEIPAYFDERKRQKDLLKGEGELFGMLDPRLEDLREFFKHDVLRAGEIAERREREKRNRKKNRAGIEVRRDRNTHF